MKQILNVVLLTCIACSLTAQNNMMKVNFFRVDSSFHVQTFPTSTSAPIYYYSEPEGGVQLLSQNPSAQGKTEVTFDEDHIPAFVLNNGIVTHLNDKLFKLANLLISLDSGIATISFNAATYGSASDIKYHVIRSGANNQESCVATLTCLGSNDEEQLGIQDSFSISEENNISYFMRVKDSTGDVLYESLPVTVGTSAARGITTNGTLPSELGVFPSPVSTELTVSGAQNDQGKPYTICDFSGRVVMTGIVKQETFQIDVRFLHNGIYWLRSGANTVSFRKE